MWIYLFGETPRYSDPVMAIRALADLDTRGEAAFLKLAPEEDVLLRTAEEGETVYLCTRDQGRWLVQGEAVAIDLPRRGGAPESMASVYGAMDERHWWRRLARVHLYSSPRDEVDLGLVAGTLPPTGPSEWLLVPAPGNGAVQRGGPQTATSPLAQLTETMDAAWDAGRLTPEAVAEAIRDFREDHPYGR